MTSKSRMFDFITRTHNPIAGGHVKQPDGSLRGCFECGYCWARGLIKTRGISKYLGRYRIHEKAILRRFKTEDFIFAADMVDIGHPRMPVTVLHDFWSWVKMQPCPVLTLTKNPAVYRESRKSIPENAVLGATVETDLDVTSYVSKAPSPIIRLKDMLAIKQLIPNRRFISVEPIMQLSPYFANAIIAIDPWAVAVGYDNYDNHLPEPRLEETEALIGDLEKVGIKVYRKTIRRAWDE